MSPCLLAFRSRQLFFLFPHCRSLSLFSLSFSLSAAVSPSNPLQPTVRIPLRLLLETLADGRVTRSAWPPPGGMGCDMAGWKAKGQFENDCRRARPHRIQTLTNNTFFFFLWDRIKNKEKARQFCGNCEKGRPYVLFNILLWQTSLYEN